MTQALPAGLAALWSHPALAPALAAARDLARDRRLPAVLVGGAVRDAWLGRPIHDLDFAVQGNAVDLARAVANRLGGDFYIMDDERGTARVLLAPPAPPPGGAGQPGARLVLDFAACRGATWDEDLFARDFTVNALAVRLADGALLDPTGGQADLARRVVRQARLGAIHDDPVRALRAVRLGLALGAEIEPDTLAAARAAATRLDQTSPERARDEFMTLLARADASRAARQLDALGLLAALVPEVEPLRTCQQSAPHRFDALEHTLVVLDALDAILAAIESGAEPLAAWRMPVSEAHRARLAAHLSAVGAGGRTRAAVFRLSVLLHDCGKPATRTVDPAGNAHFYGHAEAGAALAAARAGALRLSGDEIRWARLTVLHHMRPNLLARQGELTPRAIFRLARDVGDCLPELALLCVADGMGKAGELTRAEDRERRGSAASVLIERYYDRLASGVAPPPLIDGHDLLNLGLPPGPRIGQILEAVREAQAAEEIATREDALRLARSLLDTAA
jgi:tRNA nucleotidyltransferase/poly(A) polymerase